jgi:hypothetical protein
MKQKIGKKKLGDNTYTPFEDLVHLATMVRLKLRGRHVGAYLLKKGKADNFCFTFGFECQGIHSFLSNDEVDAIFESLEAGLKELPLGERITFHLAAFSSDRERQQQLSDLVKAAPSNELRFLLTGEKGRVQELTKQGLREPKFLRLYVTYTQDSARRGTTDWIERILGKIKALYTWFKGETGVQQQTQLRSLLTSAFTDGFLQWEQLLSTKMGLVVRALNDDELWEGLWRRFNSSEPIPTPQLLILDKKGVKEEINSQVHSTTLLLADSVPVFDRQWVWLKDNYVGALTFWDKPGGWSNKTSQLKYVTSILARDVVVNTEIFCQLTPANPTLVRTSMQRMLKQSNVTALRANEKKSIDVAAQIKTQRSVAAQEQLYEGAIPFHTAVTILVHRRSLERLDEACRYIESCFRRPAWVSRETEYTWKVLLQTLPIVNENLLATPFNRRQLYLSSEVPGLISLVCTRSRDREGLELIGEDGGTPIFLDLFTEHRNLGIFGTTRSGKSVLVSGILTQALARGIPVVALDYPKPDGTSTFSDYTEFMGEQGAYFDISKQSNNLFEIPDLRSLPDDVQQERYQDYKDFLASALLAMVINVNADQLLTQDVRTILYLAINNFFEDAQIQERYYLALEDGFGSAAWKRMPTLADFVSFCTLEQLGLGTEVDPKVIDRIRLRLKYWLGSRVGKAISTPSSVPTNAPLLVFALRQLSDGEDAAILSLAAYSAALRRALEYPASIFFIDESPILFKFPAIANLVGSLCANGAKSGIRVILTGQDPNTIAESVAGSIIFQNLTTRLIGRIQTNAIRSFEHYLEYPRTLISQNASEQFYPQPQGIYSRWLLDDRGIFTFCRYYPAYVQLAAVANNPDEQAVRAYFLRRYPDKYEAYSEYAKYLTTAIRSRKRLELPPQEQEVPLAIVS